MWIVCAYTPTRKNYLYNAILSALNIPNVVNVAISISIERQHLDGDDAPMYPSDERLTVYPVDAVPRHPTQFEHIARLVDVHDGREAIQWITFLDDDDLLLPSIAAYYVPSSNAFIATQYVTVSLNNDHVHDTLAEGATATNVVELLDKHGQECLIAHDFSGTSARLHVVQEYFSTRNRSTVADHLEDVKFMHWLETRPTVLAKNTIEPVAFHRVTSGAANSLWRREVTAELNTLLDALEKVLELDGAD